MKGKRQEIGSEFWEIPLAKQENGVFPKGTDWFISGRGALTAIIKDIKQRITFKKAALPSWCCDSVIMPFLNEGISVEFYPVFFQDGTIKRELDGVYDCDVLLTMDYFGFIRNEKPDFNGIIINDVTHSIFSGWPQHGDYIFGSLRKWAGFYTGGFAFCENRKIAVEENALDTEYIELRRLAMAKKKEYIYGNTDSKEYLDVFGEAEEFLDKYSCGKAHSEDIFAARHLDFQDIITRRRENAE